MHFPSRLRAVTTAAAAATLVLVALPVTASGAADGPLPERRIISTATPAARTVTVWEGPKTSMQAGITDAWGRPALRIAGVSSGGEYEALYAQFADEGQIRPGAFTVRPHVPRDEPMASDEVGIGGCTDAAGTLTVHEVERGAGTTVLRAAVDVDVTCGTAGPRSTQYRFASALPYRAATLAVTGPPQPWTREQVVPLVARYTNTGTIPITISSTSLAPGRDEADWTITSDTCSGRTLAPTDGCDVGLQVVPGDQGHPVTYTDLLVQDDWAASPFTRHVEGTVAPVAQAQDLQLVSLLEGVRLTWQAGPGRAPAGYEVETWSGNQRVRLARLGAGARSFLDDTPLWSGHPSYRYRVVSIVTASGGFGATTALSAAARPIPTSQVVLTAVDPGGTSSLRHVNPDDLTSATETVAGRITSAPTGRAPSGVSWAAVVDGGPGLWTRNGPVGTAPWCNVCTQSSLVDPASSSAARGQAWVTAAGELRVADETLVPQRVATVPSVPRAQTPTWTRDGLGLVVADSAGGPLRRITMTPDLSTTTGAVTVLGGTEGARSPAAAPRGDVVAYLSGAGDDTVLRLAPSTGSGAATSVAAVPGAVHLSWWPDASAVLVTARSGGTSTVERVAVAGGGRQVLHATTDTVLGAAVRSRDQQPPVVAPGTPVVSGNTATVPFTVTDDTRPVGGLQVTCSLDGSVATPCGPDGWTGRARVGQHTLTIRASDLGWSPTVVTVAFTVAARPRSSDFSGDGVPDLLTRDAAGRLYLYPGNGRGSFLPRRAYGTGWNGVSVMAVPGDFSGDGRTDLLAVDRTPTLRLYRGDGAGGLKASTPVQVGWTTRMVGIGDLDGDGTTDLLRIEDGGQMTMFPGDGRGGVLPGRALGRGWNVMTALVAAGDMTGDGYPDLLARDTTGRLHLYPGNGAGGFKNRISYGTGWNVMTALVGPGDFNGDGNVDLLARDTAGRLHLYPGNGAGGFRARISYGTGWNTMTAIIG